MITASQARSMAETRWGSGGTHGYRTNRRGAFYYSCSSHGGFVIDSRCLTPQEIADFNKNRLQPLDALEIVESKTDKVVKFRGPEVYRTVSYRSYSQRSRNVPIFFAEEDCDWCIPVLFAGITAKGMTHEAAQETYQTSVGGSNARHLRNQPWEPLGSRRRDRSRS